MPDTQSDSPQASPVSEDVFSFESAEIDSEKFEFGAKNSFDLRILKESLADVERTAQEKLRGGTAVSSFNDLLPQASPDLNKGRNGRKGVMARKNTGTAALKAAAEHVGSVKSSPIPFPKQLLLYLVR